MSRLLSLFLLLLSCQATAECGKSLALHGSESVDNCNPSSESCIDAYSVLIEYANRVKGGKDPEILNVHMHASPWRLYDGDWRIMDIEDLAAMARPHIANGVKRINLIASWTGVEPDCNSKSIAKKLSDALDGFSVTGMDGFLWIDKDGGTRTTRQAYTIWRTGIYRVRKDEAVMASLIAGWRVDAEDHYTQLKSAEGLLRVGAGWDTFYLKPEQALRAFDAAAKLGLPIAAYNAAVMRLSRGEKGDRDAAIELLLQAADKGDEKARVKLETLKKEGPAKADQTQ